MWESVPCASFGEIPIPQAGLSESYVYLSDPLCTIVAHISPRVLFFCETPDPFLAVEVLSLSEGLSSPEIKMFAPTFPLFAIKPSPFPKVLQY
jgi:hypothetical protein